MTDARVYALLCPSCGAKLNVADSLDTFGCSYCGATIKLQQGGGVVALELLAGELAGVRRGTDKTAAELALRRFSDTYAALSRELTEIEEQKRGEEAETEIQRLRVRRQRFPIVALAIVALVSFGIASLLVGAHLPQPAWISGAISASITLLVWFIVNRGVTRQLRGLDQRHKATTEELTRKEKDVRARLCDIKGRMQSAQSVADA